MDQLAVTMCCRRACSGVWGVVQCRSDQHTSFASVRTVVLVRRALERVLRRELRIVLRGLQRPHLVPLELEALLERLLQVLRRRHVRLLEVAQRLLVRRLHFPPRFTPQSWCVRCCDKCK